MKKYEHIKILLTKERGKHALELQATNSDQKENQFNSQPGFLFSLGGSAVLVVSFLCIWYLTLGDSWQQNHAWEVKAMAALAGACWMAIWACPASRIAGACTAMVLIMGLTGLAPLDGLMWRLICFSLICALSLTAWMPYKNNTNFLEFKSSLAVTAAGFSFLMMILVGLVCIFAFFPLAAGKIIYFILPI